VRLGVSRKDDTLPDRILSLKREGLHAPERLPDLPTMLDEYYLVRGWDENGIPRKEKIADLGLGQEIAEVKTSVKRTLLKPQVFDGNLKVKGSAVSAGGPRSGRRN
jgi:hypothetical protein